MDSIFRGFNFLFVYELERRAGEGESILVVMITSNIYKHVQSINFCHLLLKKRKKKTKSENHCQKIDKSFDYMNNVRVLLLRISSYLKLCFLCTEQYCVINGFIAAWQAHRVCISMATRYHIDESLQHYSPLLENLY